MNEWIRLLQPGDVELRAGFINSLPKDLRTVCEYAGQHLSDETIAPIIGADDLEPFRFQRNGQLMIGFLHSATVQRLRAEVDGRWKQCVVDSGRSLTNGEKIIPPGRSFRDIEIAYGFNAIVRDSVFQDEGLFEMNAELRRSKRETILKVMMDTHLLNFMVAHWLGQRHFFRRPLAA